MDDHYHYHYHPCPIGIDAPGVQYTFTRVHARIHNGHLREENRACRTRRRTSRRGSSCVSGSDERASVPQLTASCSCSWQAERTTRRHSRDDPRDDVGVRVGLVGSEMCIRDSNICIKIQQTTVAVTRVHILNDITFKILGDMPPVPYGSTPLRVALTGISRVRHRVRNF